MIYVDLDNTLTDLLTPWLQVINDIENSSYTLEDIDTYHNPILMDHMDIIKNVNLYTYPFKGAPEFISALKEFDDVCILSRDVGGAEFKKYFVYMWFPNTELKLVYGDKIVEKGDILIDDYKHNIDGKLLLFNYAGMYSYVEKGAFNSYIAVINYLNFMVYN